MLSDDRYLAIPEERRNQPWCVSLVKFLNSYEDASSLWRLFNVWGKSQQVFDSTHPEIYRILVQAKNEQAVAQQIRAEINLNGAQQTKQWAKNFYGSYEKRVGSRGLMALRSSLPVSK